MQSGIRKDSTKSNSHRIERLNFLPLGSINGTCTCSGSRFSALRWRHIIFVLHTDLSQNISGIQNLKSWRISMEGRIFLAMSHSKSISSFSVPNRPSVGGLTTPGFNSIPMVLWGPTLFDREASCGPTATPPDATGGVIQPHRGFSLYLVSLYF